jgi:hypothetical protein
MAFRMRKSISVAPGVRPNVSKRGIGASVGAVSVTRPIRLADGRSLPGQQSATLLSKPSGAWRSLVSAPVWGTGGPRFKSGRPDKQKPPQARGFRLREGLDRVGH